MLARSWPEAVCESPSTWSHGTEECFEAQATATTCLQNEKKKHQRLKKSFRNREGKCQR